MTTRCNNWPAKLTLFVEEKRNQPFNFATNNCCFFACDWLAILTGSDPARPFRKRVKDALSAARIITASGGVEGIASDICEKNNWPEITPTWARRGDVVSMETGHGPALGVCLGTLSAFPGPDGIQFMNTGKCRKAWRIG